MPETGGVGLINPLQMAESVDKPIDTGFVVVKVFISFLDL